MTEHVATGGCACGSVRFTAKGHPVRVGLCHCMTCRKAHGSAFNAFVVFRHDQLDVKGELRTWQSSPGFQRLFCPACGSRLVSREPGGSDVELPLGSFDQPGLFVPDYEVWIMHREPWLPAMPMAQHQRDRPA